MRTIDSTQSSVTTTLGYQNKTCVFVKNGRAEKDKTHKANTGKIKPDKRSSTSVTQMGHVYVDDVASSIESVRNYAGGNCSANQKREQEILHKHEGKRGEKG